MSRVPGLSRASHRVRRTLVGIRQRRVDPESLSADLSEDANGYEITFDAPGVTPEELEVRYVDGSVDVRVERYRDTYEGFELRVAERSLAFAETIELPADADVSPESGAAVVRANGTLHVTVPKEASAEDAPPAPDAPRPADS